MRSRAEKGSPPNREPYIPTCFLRISDSLIVVSFDASSRAFSLGIAIWALYLLPLGLTRWSSLEPFLVAGACTVLIILGYLYSPPGASLEVAIINRGLGVVMVWTAAVFLKFGKPSSTTTSRHGHSSLNTSVGRKAQGNPPPSTLSPRS